MNGTTASAAPLPPYPLPGFDPRDFAGPDDPRELDDRDAADRLALPRHPPIIRLRWLFLVIRFVGYVIATGEWIRRHLHWIRRSLQSVAPSRALAASVVTSSATIVDGTSASMATTMSTTTTTSTPAPALEPAPTPPQFLVALILPILRSLILWLPIVSHVLPATLQPANTPTSPLPLPPSPQTPSTPPSTTSLSPVWLLSILVDGALQLVRDALDALLGRPRSWVNIFDDSFDIQHCVRELQPSHRTSSSGSSPSSTESGVSSVLQTRDALYPYDKHAHLGFPPVVTPLDVVLAFFSKLAYEDEPCLTDELTKWGVHHDVTVCSYDSRQAQLDEPFDHVVFQSRAIVVRTGHAAVVCFRGTYPTSIVQWLTDFSAQQEVYPGQNDTTPTDPAAINQLVRVHRGFFCALGLPAICNPAAPETLFTRIVRLLHERRETIQEVYVTGHSLGAALATMFSYALRSDFTLASWLQSEADKSRGGAGAGGTPADAVAFDTGSRSGTAEIPPPPPSMRRHFTSYNLKTKQVKREETRAHERAPSMVEWLSTTASTVLAASAEDGRVTFATPLVAHTFASPASSASAPSPSSSSPSPSPSSLTEPARMEATPALVKTWIEHARAKMAGVYLYGSPRVGNDKFADDFDRLFRQLPVHRFINQADVVTHLPPPIAGDDSGELVFGYAHVGGLRFIDRACRVPYVVNQDAPPTPWISLNLFDHNPGSYVRHINAALNTQTAEVHAVKRHAWLKQREQVVKRKAAPNGHAGAAAHANGVPAN